jgi:hypothetical protein
MFEKILEQKTLRSAWPFCPYFQNPYKPLACARAKRPLRNAPQKDPGHVSEYGLDAGHI